MIKNKVILVLAPHTDDGELGCGGTISKLLKINTVVHYAAFSACEQSVVEGFPRNILSQEVKAATGSLGISPSNLHLFDFEVRNFNFRRQEILETLIILKNKVKPDLIIMPSINDTHQDHKVVAEEALRAFKNNNIISYELPWNNFDFTNTMFILLEEGDVANKINSLNQYKSQCHRSYFSEDYLRSLALTRGVQVNSQFAEVFEVVRLVC